MIIAISGPSGVGKGSILEGLIEIEPGIAYSISITTRRKRPNEKDGVSYYYRSEEEFERMLKNGEILEWDQFCGNKYGTPYSALEGYIKEGRDVALDITLSGAKAIKEHFKDEAITVFLFPPTLDALEHRIRKRKSETDEQIKDRLKSAEKELKEFEICDYVIMNDDLESAVLELREIIHVERKKSFRNRDILDRYNI